MNELEAVCKRLIEKFEKGTEDGVGEFVLEAAEDAAGSVNSNAKGVKDESNEDESEEGDSDGGGEDGLADKKQIKKKGWVGGRGKKRKMTP
jgi:hypothetical protein